MGFVDSPWRKAYCSGEVDRRCVAGEAKGGRCRGRRKNSGWKVKWNFKKLKKEKEKWKWDFASIHMYKIFIYKYKISFTGFLYKTLKQYVYNNSKKDTAVATVGRKESSGFYVFLFMMFLFSLSLECSYCMHRYKLSSLLVFSKLCLVGFSDTIRTFVSQRCLSLICCMLHL